MSSYNYRANKEGVFLERIPEHVYQEIVELFSDEYHFKNGERMRIANYFVGMDRDVSDSFVQFIEEVTEAVLDDKYPRLAMPEGFQPHSENMLKTELDGNFSFASFDMAVTEGDLQNIEFQAVATYPMSAAKLNQSLLESLPLDDAYIFADDPNTAWGDFIDQYQNIVAGGEAEGVVLTDRLINKQKTNFEFYATQKEIPLPIEIVDMEEIFEEDGNLYHSKNQQPTKINRLYNRILLAEALFEDNYPHNDEVWKFRFDKKYDALKFINHPNKLYEVSKRLSPYVDHPFNPPSFELSEVAGDFRNGKLRFDEYIWKHKWGGAGHRLIMSPDASILDSLANDLGDYIAQKKVDFKIFKTDDGQEKIVELRFMTATHNDKTIVVPMARIGHVSQDEMGVTKYKIHFGDNNEEGYGFSPVVIFDS